LVLAGRPRLLPLDPARSALELNRKDAAWLCLIAVYGPVPRQRLASWVWPDSDGMGALNNLRQRIFRLRRATGAGLIELKGAVALAPDLQSDESIHYLVEGGGLPKPTLELDSLGLTHHITRLLSLGVDWMEGCEYEDCPDFGRRLSILRRRWTALRQTCSLELVDAAWAAGDRRSALGCAQRALLEFPVCEDLHRRVMQLHHELGERAAAIQAFEICECILREELGVRPSDHTVELLHKIERLAYRTPDSIE